MARIRTIKPEFPESESIGRLTRDARLLFIQLWTIADDYGRCRAGPRLLAGKLYPYDEDALHLIGGWLDELETNDLVIRYVVEGNQYLEVVNWAKHQRVDNAGKSNVPPRPDSVQQISRSEIPRTAESSGDSPLDLGPRTKEGNGSPPPDKPAVRVTGFDEFYSAYPKHVDRRDAERKYADAVKAGVLPERLLAAAKAYANRCRCDKTEAQFIKSPAVWLKKGCWDDEDARGPPAAAAGFRKAAPDDERWPELSAMWAADHGGKPPLRIEWQFPDSYFARLSKKSEHAA